MLGMTVVVISAKIVSIILRAASVCLDSHELDALQNSVAESLRRHTPSTTACHTDGQVLPGRQDARLCASSCVFVRSCPGQVERRSRNWEMIAAVVVVRRLRRLSSFIWPE